MISPQLLQNLAERLCREYEAAAAIITILHGEKHCEMVIGQNPSACFSLAEIFRSAAEHAEELRPDETLAQRNGVNRPGDVFRINGRAARWSGLLVTAKEIYQDGILGFAQVPQGSGKCTRAYARLEWREINFIGRPAGEGRGEKEKGSKGASELKEVLG